MLSISKSSRAARISTARKFCTRPAASKNSSVNAATTVVPISQVQVDTTSQPTGFFATLQQMFAKKEEHHEDEHAHAHVMFHSHIAEMLASEVPKTKVAAQAVSAASSEEEMPHFHDDHAHHHTMFHSHIADAKAFE